ncbi:MAG: ABC transporter ATP-binding protein [Verrucomicrobiota bacterium]|nr:ABC transporter ATP-binding protein [Verrucomicrobiota bacterium]
MSNDAPLLSLKNISRKFPSAEGGAPLEVLRGLSMEVARGESIAIVGPSGCGKSTLLNLIGTLDQPTGGTINFDGRDLLGLDADELALLRNREMGFIFQSHHLLPQCSVMENVLVPTLAHGRATANDEERARRLLDRVGLGERLAHRPGQLSGGERQRVAVVRALINQPQLLLADEPTGALDQATADQLGQLLIELNAEENVTLITVTHSEKLAGRMARTMELKDGQIKT